MSLARSAPLLENRAAPGIAACQVVALPRDAVLVPVAFVVLQHGARLDEAAAIARVEMAEALLH